MMLNLENSDHSIILFHLPFYRHRHLLVRKIVFSQKALRCTCVLRWGHGWGDTAAGFCWDKEWQRNMCVFSGPTQKCWGGKVKGGMAIWTGRWENWCETLRQFPSSQEFLSVGNCSWKETQLWLALSGFSCIRNSAGWSLISDIIDKSVAELDIKLMINFLVALFFPNRYIPYLKVLLSNKFGRAFFPCLTTKKNMYLP